MATIPGGTRWWGCFIQMRGKEARHASDYLKPHCCCAAGAVPRCSPMPSRSSASCSWSFTLPEPGVGNYGRAVTDPLISSRSSSAPSASASSSPCSRSSWPMRSPLVWVRGTPRQRLIAELCILIPFWISVLTRAFGWVALLSNRGLINTWLTQLGVISRAADAGAQRIRRRRSA